MSAYFPLTNHGWFKLESILGDKVIIHAVRIEKTKGRITSHHKNHKVEEAKATGSVEITSRIFLQELDITKYS